MNRIKELTDKKEKNLKEVAQDLEIPYTTFAGYYQGRSKPRKDEVWKNLANYFEVSVPYLMGISALKHELPSSDYERGYRDGIEQALKILEPKMKELRDYLK